MVPRTQSSAMSDQTNPGPQPGLADLLMAAAIQARFAKRMPGADMPSPNVKGLKAEQYDMEMNVEGPGKIHAEGTSPDDRGAEKGTEDLAPRKERGI